MKRAILFMAWGEEWIREAVTCLKTSLYIHDYDIFLITDKEGVDIFSRYAADSDIIDRVDVVEVQFSFPRGFLRKTELMDYVPNGYDSFCFLDSDTRVIEDITLGFEKAEIHGLALVPAPQYSLDHFWGFDQIMLQEKLLLRGQIQYNTGVIFFRDSPDVRRFMGHWRQLAEKYKKQYPNDQPLFSLALEQMGVIPYTLSIGYNYRGFGEGICGLVRIWHSHGEMPDGINRIVPEWPLRKASPGKIIYPTTDGVEGWVEGATDRSPAPS